MMKFSHILSALLFGCVMSQDVADAAVDSPNAFSVLVGPVANAELDEALRTTQDSTAFAPNNDAFGKLHQSSLNLLKTEQWRPHLKNLLLQHVLPAEVPSNAVADGITATALSGEEVKLNLPMSGGVVVNDIANAVQPDVTADNGITRVLDTVLFPEWVSANIVDRAVSDPDLTTLTKLVSGLHLTRELSLRGPFAVFAPTDEAFENSLKSLGVEDGTLSFQLASTLVTHHVVHGVCPASDVKDGLELTTIQGEEIRLSFNGDAPPVNGQNFLTTDILANNGTAHEIDGLSLPKSVVKAPEIPTASQTTVDVAISNSGTFSSLVDFVAQADLVDPLSSQQGLTVFAPTNDALASLANAAPDIVANLQTKEWSTHLQDVLLCHVLPVEVGSSAVTDGLMATALNGEDLAFTLNGDEIFVNSGSKVLLPDVDASNGIIHAVDSVLIPSWVSNSIVDRAIGSPVLSTLVDLVVSAGLAEVLSGTGPFTVFAPTNDAFLEFLGDGTDSESLDIDLVSSILTYHVVPGIYSTAEIANRLSLTAVQGEDVSFSLMGGKALVNGETIVVADILASNGIVHVIDGVLIPNEATTSVVMQESFGSPIEQTTLSFIGADQTSSSNCHQKRLTAITAAMLGFGTAIGAVF